MQDDDQERAHLDSGRIESDDPAPSASVDGVETAELELVTTQQLQAILASEDDASRRSIEDAAASDNDGVLVRNTATGLFKIVDDSVIQPILDEAGENSGSTADQEPTLELSLVNTQLLRTVMDAESEAESTAKAKPDDAGGGGFDPYNSS